MKNLVSVAVAAAFALSGAAAVAQGTAGSTNKTGSDLSAQQKATQGVTAPGTATAGAGTPDAKKGDMSKESRADVKAGARDAAKSNAKGGSDLSEAEKTAAGVNKKTAMPTDATRAQVKAEASAANKAGTKAVSGEMSAAQKADAGAAKKP